MFCFVFFGFIIYLTGSGFNKHQRKLNVSTRNASTVFFAADICITFQLTEKPTESELLVWRAVHQELHVSQKRGGKSDRISLNVVLFERNG